MEWEDLDRQRVWLELECRLMNDSWEVLLQLEYQEIPDAIRTIALTQNELGKALNQGHIAISPEFNRDQFELATYGTTTFTSALDMLLNFCGQLAECLSEQHWVTIDLSVVPPRQAVLEYTSYKPYYPTLAENARRQAQETDPETYGPSWLLALRLFDITSMQFNIDDPDLWLYRSQARRVNQAVWSRDFSQLWTSERLEIFEKIVWLVAASGMIQPGIVPPLWKGWERGDCHTNAELLQYFLEGPTTQHLIEIKPSNDLANRQGHYTEIKFTDSGVVSPKKFEPHDLVRAIQRAAEKNFWLIKSSYESRG